MKNALPLTPPVHDGDDETGAREPMKGGDTAVERATTDGPVPPEQPKG